MNFKKLYFLIGVLIIFSACSKEENEYVRCTINGIAYEDLDIGAFINSSNIATFGANFDNDSIVLNADVPNVTGTGTYSFNTGTLGQLSINYYHGTPYYISSTFPASHGSLTITEVGNQSPWPRIRGNFNGVAYNTLGDSLVITDGEVSGW